MELRHPGFFVAGAALLAVAIAAPAATVGADEIFAAGMAKEKNGDLTGAIADFTRVVVLDPQRVEAFFQRGRAYANHNELEPAWADFNRVLELQPKHPEALTARGRLKFQRGDPAGGFADFER